MTTGSVSLKPGLIKMIHRLKTTELCSLYTHEIAAAPSGHTAPCHCRLILYFLKKKKKKKCYSRSISPQGPSKQNMSQTLYFV
jgi:hypothetical protein